MSISNRWWKKDGHFFQPTTGTEGKVGEMFSEMVKSLHSAAK